MRSRSIILNLFIQTQFMPLRMNRIIHKDYLVTFAENTYYLLIPT